MRVSAMQVLQSSRRPEATSTRGHFSRAKSGSAGRAGKGELKTWVRTVNVGEI